VRNKGCRLRDFLIGVNRSQAALNVPRMEIGSLVLTAPHSKAAWQETTKTEDRVNGQGACRTRLTGSAYALQIPNLQ
jgi:hypothetical protein